FLRQLQENATLRICLVAVQFPRWSKRTGFVRYSYGVACADSASRITMSPRQVFGPLFVQVTPPSVQVEFKVPQALSQFGRDLHSVQVAPVMSVPQPVAWKILLSLFCVIGYT